MAAVFVGHSFADKYVSQMAIAVGADDLGAVAVGVGQVLDRASNLIVKTGPAAAGRKLVSRAVEWRIALFADEGAGGIEVIVLAAERRLRALVQNNALLFGVERVERRRV